LSPGFCQSPETYRSRQEDRQNRSNRLEGAHALDGLPQTKEGVLHGVQAAAGGSLTEEIDAFVDSQNGLADEFHQRKIANLVGVQGAFEIDGYDLAPTL